MKAKIDDKLMKVITDERDCSWKKKMMTVKIVERGN